MTSGASPRNRASPGVSRRRRGGLVGVSITSRSGTPAVSQDDFACRKAEAACIVPAILPRGGGVVFCSSLGHVRLAVAPKVAPGHAERVFTHSTAIVERTWRREPRPEKCRFGHCRVLPGSPNRALWRPNDIRRRKKPWRSFEADRPRPPVARPDYDSIAETIGNTPRSKIPNITAEDGIKADICLKLEFFNPIASVKDRIGVNMILAAEADGRLKPGGTIIEPTSGNTGIGLAFVAAARGYKLILTMPKWMSIERRKMLAYLGAELVLTPRAGGRTVAPSPRRRNCRRRTRARSSPASSRTPANPDIHRRTTAEEMWFDTDGKVDVIVSGIGTGGTLTGCAQALKPRKPGLRMVAVEPAASPVLSGGKPAPQPIQGIGAGFIPEILDVPGRSTRSSRRKTQEAL